MLFNLFYFPQNAVYFIMLSFPVQIILRVFMNHVLKFKYQLSDLKVNRAALTFLMQDKKHNFNYGHLNKNLPQF